MTHDPREALAQIRAVCIDNADVERKDLALRFILNVAEQALTASAPKGDETPVAWPNDGELLELLEQAGFDSNEAHPKCYRSFGWKTFTEKLKARVYTSPPPAAGWDEAKTRRMFETEFAPLDLTEDKDAWGQPKFKHSHVDAIYEGWRRAVATLRREAPAPSGVVKDDLDAKIAALAHCFWSIHPSTIAAKNLTREQFYAQEMTKLIKAVRR